MKVIYSGLEGSGKSLRLAVGVRNLVTRNHKWFLQSGIVRPIWSNMHFTEDFAQWATEEMGVPIYYWQNTDDLILIDNADVIMDEVGNYFDSRMWADLSLDVRRWLTQGSKSGIEIYGSAQDFAQVDKAFRRLVNHLYHITKVIGSRRPAATKPPVEKIWGICLEQELDPRGYDEDKKKFDSSSIVPGFFFIHRDDCLIFDTTEKIKRSKPMPYRHELRVCELHPTGGCDFSKIIHA